MDSVPVLVGVEGMLAGRSFEVTATGLRLGREPGNEVWLDDSGVSRQHARVILHNGAVWVQDAGSRNGVFVNGERVADHRALNAGDRVVVGAHAFELRMGGPGGRVSNSPTVPFRRAEGRATYVGGASSSPRWRALPFAIAGMITLGCIGCFGAYGLLRGQDEPPLSAAPAPAWSLSTVVPEGGTVAPAASPPSVSVADALAVAAGADADAQRAKLPEPPAGSTVAELTERASVLYETGRLNDARTTYQMALKLDPACPLCPVRIDRLNGEIAAKAQSQLDNGMRYWDSMQKQQAVAAWETVLLLVPDAGDPLHQRALESLAKAGTSK